MLLADLLSHQPPVKNIPDLRKTIRDTLVRSGKCLVVIDDDPTGMQAVQDVDVYMDWSVATLRQALASGVPVFFVSVNTRSLNPADAAALAFDVGRNLRQAVDAEKKHVLLASRSDSTLRGHFPHEVNALTSGFGLHPDGLIFAPALLEAGRYTIDDVQWAEQHGEVFPVGETEFARDLMFRFTNSNLKAWIEEKTGGKITSAAVHAITLAMLREDGPELVTRELLKFTENTPIIVNAASYADLDVFCDALQQAEALGKTFFYRCSASFLKSRGGFPDRALLSHSEMVAHNGPGLIIAGSYVEKTSRQLQTLLDAGIAESVELAVDRVLDDKQQLDTIEGVQAEVESKLARGISVVLYTTRQLHKSTGQDFALTGKMIMHALCDVVAGIKTKPAYLVAKGGITSIEIARTALGVQKVHALGQILPGVPVWQLGGESRWPGLAYVVFPGNVGDDTAVLRAVKTLSEDST
jgi:uncharacterized protein YgbK (DUF1537 family)